MLGFGPAPGGEVPAGGLVFEIGSVTKVFTTSLLADLVHEGAVRLESRVAELLPARVRSPWWDASPMTLEDLATHTSGMPRVPKNLKVTRASRSNPYASYTVEQLYDYLAGYRSTTSLPARFAYSNLGMGLLGHILAGVMGVSYEEAIRQRICRPLQMADTCIALDAEQQRRLVPGHSFSGRPVPNWDLPALAGAGALRSTANDLLKFLSANLAPHAGPLAERLTLCHSPRRVAERRSRVGLGWVISEVMGRRVLWHDGATGGYNSYAAVVPEEGLGVCVLTNHAVPPLALLGLARTPADDIGLRVLKLLLE